MRENTELSNVCLVPDLRPHGGGPAHFQRRLAAGLARAGVAITFGRAGTTAKTRAGGARAIDAILVINATRDLFRLWHAKRRGVRIVQRLGIPNWVHRCRPERLQGFIRAEAANGMMQVIRKRIADHVVYQSIYARDFWNRTFGPALVSESIVYNGVDLEQFAPDGPAYSTGDAFTIVSVEGTLGTGPDDVVMELVRGLQEAGTTCEALVFGKADQKTIARMSSEPQVRYMGAMPNESLPFYYRGAALFLSTDVIAACPNSVIEALACGSPILGFGAGVLPELLCGRAGKCVDYRTDALKWQPHGNSRGLLDAALFIASHQAELRQQARQLAERRYGMTTMIEAYQALLFP